MGGYFGNLEVFSKQAFQTLLDNVDTCYDAIDWKLGVHGGKYGPMGEDLFAQQCMDMMKVSKQENFMLSTDGACEADRPEGGKKKRTSSHRSDLAEAAQRVGPEGSFWFPTPQGADQVLRMLGKQQRASSHQ